MNIEQFIEKIMEKPDTIEFNEVMEVIDNNYKFISTSFVNGALENKAGENSGSCKLFAFAQLQGLNEKQTLACFGRYYREDVLNNPTADNHQNIRNFMKTGWQGISFEGAPLTIKKH